MREFNVSVIIPVYNAASFLENAVMSAVQLEEVKEVILIEDGSKDDSLNICRDLASRISKVKLLFHENHQNKGAGATRNLGLRQASCDYIAFLDADDYFLPNRFEKAKVLFNEDPELEGIYEPVRCEFVTTNDRLKFIKMKKIRDDQADDYLSYPETPLIGEEFFESLILGTNGYPCTDGILIKKTLLSKSGYFNESLRLHQDSELWIRMAYHGKFSTPQSREPIAARIQHPLNRITSRTYASQMEFTKVLLEWGESVSLKKELIFNMKKRIEIYSLHTRENISPPLKKILIRYINLKYYLKIRLST